ncbi:MAG TPA: acetyl-CoA C-acyltransferase, partial [Gaiellaceae bacterium]
MAVKAVRELLRRNPEIPPERIGDVVFAATAQVGDQGLTLGRDVALLAGIPETVPGFAVDRMCAGALTAVTAAAGEIALGAVDVALAGGVEHMGHHPMGENVDFNPRFVSERLIDESAASMGQTAENLHDRFPAITKERADAFALASHQKATAAWAEATQKSGVMKETVVPMSVFSDDGWKVADRDEFLRPDTTMEGLASLKPAFRAGGRVTAGNSAGLTDGATAAFLASEHTAEELGLKPKLRLVGFAYSGVEPHLMGYGPVPATKRVLEQAGIALDEVDLFELNEPFAVQVLTWCDELGIAGDDPRLNPYGGAIACGHPLAATGVRLIAQLAYGLRDPLGERPVSDTQFKLNAAGSIALVTIDNGEDYRKPTTLGRSAFESAVRVLDELENGDWTAAVFTGKPFVFCVGADIDEFTKTRSADDAREGIRAGHGLFGRIRALPFPTVAAINGAALGGGLELALHCTARTLATNVRHIGFPEVALSIIPGWGGTQLLPKLIGPEAAAKVIVLNPLRQNKLLTAPEAFELGIVDKLVAPVEFVDESLQFARELAELDRPVPDWSELETVLRKARSRVDDAVHGATRAPYVALDLIEGAKDWTLEEGYAAE